MAGGETKPRAVRARLARRLGRVRPPNLREGREKSGQARELASEGSVSCFVERDHPSMTSSKFSDFLTLSPLSAFGTY